MLVPSASNSCPLCDYEFVAREEADSSKGELSGFTMSEIDLLTQRSNFEWCDIFDGGALMASGFNAFSGIFFLNDHWYSVGGTEFGIKFYILRITRVCLAKADDFLNEKWNRWQRPQIKSWLKQTASTRQLQCLPLSYPQTTTASPKYKAANLLKFYFNKTSIQKLLFEADAKRHAGGAAWESAYCKEKRHGFGFIPPPLPCASYLAIARWWSILLHEMPKILANNYKKKIWSTNQNEKEAIESALKPVWWICKKSAWIAHSSLLKRRSFVFNWSGITAYFDFMQGKDLKLKIWRCHARFQHRPKFQKNKSADRQRLTTEHSKQTSVIILAHRVLEFLVIALCSLNIPTRQKMKIKISLAEL